jgi:CRP-like cAMP-binding protein
MSRLDLLKKLPLFAGLTESDLTTVCKDFTRLQFRQGEAIFYQGDPGHSLYLIESGQVRIYMQSEDGQELSMNLLGTGDIFGEMALIDGLPRSASAIAMEMTAVLSLSRERFRDHLRRTPQLAFNFLQLMSRRIRHNNDQFDTLTLSVHSRLARKLLELAQKHGLVEPEGVRINLALTQTDLASLLVTSRESINKALAKLRQQGLIRQHLGQIIIIDPEALRALTK